MYFAPVQPLSGIYSSSLPTIAAKVKKKKFCFDPFHVKCLVVLSLHWYSILECQQPADLTGNLPNATYMFVPDLQVAHRWLARALQWN